MQVIQKWLKERQALLIALQDLCSFRPYQHNQQTVVMATHLQQFCQTLVDYLSRGHFEVFAKLQLKTIPRQQWEVILHTTHVGLNFSDKYSVAEIWDNLDLELSYVAEQLAGRFECEDRLIQTFYLRQGAAQVIRLAKTA